MRPSSATSSPVYAGLVDGMPGPVHDHDGFTPFIIRSMRTALRAFDCLHWHRRVLALDARRLAVRWQQMITYGLPGPLTSPPRCPTRTAVPGINGGDVRVIIRPSGLAA